MKRFFLLILIFSVVISFACPSFAGAYGYSVISANAEIIVNGEKILPERDLLLINGRMLAPAKTVFENLGARIECSSDSRKIDMIKDDVTISMEVGSNIAKVSDADSIMDAPPLLIRETVMVPVRFVSQALGADVEWDGLNRVAYIGENLTKPAVPEKSEKNHIVVIDAGHGGKQQGAVYGGVKEKDLNIDVAKRLDELLKAEGIKTYMTREKDMDMDLYERSELANKVGANLFVSIHHNAGNSEYSGSMTLYCPSSKGSFTGRDLAEIVQKEITSKLGTKNLGTISRPNLVVLRTTKMPAVIAEIGYMTNSAELKRLKSESFRQDSAEALKDAVMKALEKSK